MAVVGRRLGESEVSVRIGNRKMVYFRRTNGGPGKGAGIAQCSQDTPCHAATDLQLAIKSPPLREVDHTPVENCEIRIFFAFSGAAFC